MVALAGQLNGVSELTCQCDNPDCTKKICCSGQDAPRYLPQDVIVVATECLSSIPDGFVVWKKRPGYALCGPKKVQVVCQCLNPHCHHVVWMSAKMFEKIRLTDQVIIAKDCPKGAWPGMVVAHRGEDFITYTYKC